MILIKSLNHGGDLMKKKKIRYLNVLKYTMLYIIIIILFTNIFNIINAFFYINLILVFSHLIFFAASTVILNKKNSSFTIDDTLLRDILEYIIGFLGIPYLMMFLSLLLSGVILASYITISLLKFILDTSKYIIPILNNVSALTTTALTSISLNIFDEYTDLNLTFLHIIIFWSIVTYLLPPIIKTLIKVLKNFPLLEKIVPFLSWITVDIIRFTTYIIAFFVYIYAYINIHEYIYIVYSDVIKEALLAYIIIDVSLGIIYHILSKFLHKKSNNKKYVFLNRMLWEIQYYKRKIIITPTLISNKINTRLRIYVIDELEKEFKSKKIYSIQKKIFLFNKKKLFYDKYLLENYINNKKILSILEKRRCSLNRDFTNENNKKSYIDSSINNLDLEKDIIVIEEYIILELYKLQKLKM